MKKILLTGGSGLIGHFLLQRLLQEGHQVYALHRNALPELSHPNLKWIQGDITDSYLLRDLISKVTDIYHCAGLVSYAPQDEELLRQINVEGTANVVDACLENPAVRLCHVSSIAAINRKKGEALLNEKAKWDETIERSNYALSKHYAEMEVWRGITEGLKAVIVNPSIVLGPADWNRSSTQLFKYVFKEHALYTQGYANFVDVRDVVEAMLSLMQAELWGHRYILNAHQITYYAFFQQVADVWHKKAPWIEVPGVVTELIWRLEHARAVLTGARPLITKDTARIAKEKHFYSNEKIRNAIGIKFRPLEETIRWCCLSLVPSVSSEAGK